MNSIEKKLIFLTFLLILAASSPSISYSLERDYSYTGSYLENDREPDAEDEYGDDIYYYNSHELCYRCFDKACSYEFPSRHERELDIDTIPPITKQTHKDCSACYEDPAIYTGYLHFRYKGNYPFLKRQIGYSKKYPRYQSYWPETSYKAEKISDVAVILFEDLINSTALEKVKLQPELSKNFITDSWYFENLDFTLPRSLSCTCFRFSDFYQVCKDLILFSQSHFTVEECAFIEDKIDAMLDRLCGMFLEVYEESLSLHPTAEIYTELEFIELLYSPEKNIKIEKRKNNLNGRQNFNFAKEARINIFKNYYDKFNSSENSIHNLTILPDWLNADYWLHEGIRCNDLFLHTDAITYLTAAIKQDPYNIEAYQERVHAHFEMGNLGLAIEDYNKINQLKGHKNNFLLAHHRYVVNWDNKERNDYPITPNPKGMVDYTGGFCMGITKGSSVALIELVPSTWSCCKGILHGLWSFACSPTEVSKELIKTSYELAQFIKENTTKECLETVVPELKDLCISWDTLSEYDKGNKTGYIIGKYGIDILAPGTIMKGIKKYRHLKRLNSVFTVECCAVSEVKRLKILEASFKHAYIRSTVAEAAKTGKIIPRNANVIPHVMSEKHSWNKLLKLSGNQFADFRKVTEILEKKNILQNGKKELLGTFLKDNKRVSRYQYTIEIEGYTVEAHFIEYVGENQSFLSNAWVITQN